MYEEQPRVIPAGNYVIVARVVEAKDVCAIKTFDMWQTITSFSVKAATENADALPNVTTKVKLSRAGFPTQKRKTAVEKETVAAALESMFLFRRHGTRARRVGRVHGELRGVGRAEVR